MKSSHKKIIAGLGVGTLVLGSAGPAFAFDTGVIDWAIGELCGHISGHLGGLLVTTAAFGAIIAAAMGSYRVFYGALITAVGAFAVSSIMSLYFPEAANLCNSGGGAAARGTGDASIARGVGDAGSTDPFDSVADNF